MFVSLKTGKKDQRKKKKKERKRIETDLFHFASSAEKPTAPESLSATDVTETTVSLKWQPPSSDGGLPIKTYIVERRDKRWGSWVKAGTTKGTVTTLEVENLVTGQEYCFRVSAENEEGTGPATEMKELVKPTREPGE